MFKVADYAALRKIWSTKLSLGGGGKPFQASGLLVLRDPKETRWRNTSRKYSHTGSPFQSFLKKSHKIVISSECVAIENINTIDERRSKNRKNQSFRLPEHCF